MKNKLLLLLPLVMLATACSEEHSDLQAWMQETQQNAKNNLQPPEAPVAMERVSYSDPAPIIPSAYNILRMKPDLNNAKPINLVDAPDLKRPKELLESYALSQLKFVGTIGSGNALSALVEAEGHVYTVKLGNYMGRDYGKVVKITPDEITLSESVEKANEGWHKRPAVMVLGGTVQSENQEASK